VNEDTDSAGTPPPPPDELFGGVFGVEGLLEPPELPHAAMVSAPAASTATNASFFVNKAYPLTMWTWPDDDVGPGSFPDMGLRQTKFMIPGRVSSVPAGFVKR
jgi:hypothetical protein